ncbi:hypothetical protein VV01_01990 [Luteipulveratus halotolerans]|uniref:Uncharacterized protein n=1 Tax=Luteipulveratus halotolerans TaxID=1631356 RepID=A0A0L6CF40_9MICO|nr:hypothetical protein VV01_01990 [Luteipulveratus halotolerans]
MAVVRVGAGSDGPGSVVGRCDFGVVGRDDAEVGDGVVLGTDVDEPGSEVNHVVVVAVVAGMVVDGLGVLVAAGVEVASVVLLLEPSSPLQAARAVTARTDRVDATARFMDEPPRRDDRCDPSADPRQREAA